VYAIRLDLGHRSRNSLVGQEIEEIVITHVEKTSRVVPSDGARAVEVQDGSVSGGRLG
jgi:hypothetical protein